MSELKPCPFCGGKAYFYNYDKGYEENNYFMIWCDNCECAETPQFKTEQEAIFAWNKRAK